MAKKSSSKNKVSEKEISPESERIMREEVISANVAEGYVDGALSTAALLRRKLTKQELETILAKQISSGYFEGVSKTLGALRRELSERETVQSVNTLIKLGKLLAACKLAKKLLGMSRIKLLKAIQEKQVEYGLDDSAKETEKLINKTKLE